MRVTVNGEPRELSEGSSVAELVAALGLRPEIVAVERNRELVPRARPVSYTHLTLPTIYSV